MDYCICLVWGFCSLALPKVHLIILQKMMGGKLVNTVSEGAYVV